MPLTKKAMVLFDEKKYKRIAEFAKSRHISVGQVIREAVDAVVSKKGGSEERIKAAMRLTATDAGADWDEFERTVMKAEKEGPQRITVHGHSTAVVISSKEYERLKQPRGSFVSFMRQSPLYGVELDLTREQTPTRKTDVE